MVTNICRAIKASFLVLVVVGCMNNTVYAVGTRVPNPNLYKKGTLEYEQELRAYQEWQERVRREGGNKIAAFQKEREEAALRVRQERERAQLQAREE